MGNNFKSSIFNSLYSSDDLGDIQNIFSLFPKIQTTTSIKHDSSGWSLLKGENHPFIIYKWVDQNNVMIGAPGCEKSDIKADLVNNKLRVSWDTEFSKADFTIPIPDKTKNVEVDVKNGMITINFQQQESDISIIMK